MEKMEDELSEEFAARVQNIIAKVANAQPMFFQGTLYYKTTEQVFLFYSHLINQLF
jgi:predicted 2-oxoglutarate/Fe(II)-dependent dioxygenase YbiX